MRNPQLNRGVSVIEVAVLLAVTGFFVVAAAPLFSRFLQVRTSNKNLLQAALLAQDIMERVRGKRFEDLKGKLGNGESVELSWNVQSELKDFLYDDNDGELPSPPPEWDIRLVIRKEQGGQQQEVDMLIAEVKISWPEPLRTSSGNENRTYRIATRVYKEGIEKLRKR